MEGLQKITTAASVKSDRMEYVLEWISTKVLVSNIKKNPKGSEIPTGCQPNLKIEILISCYEPFAKGSRWSLKDHFFFA
jgi:hypothetical protein